MTLYGPGIPKVQEFLDLSKSTGEGSCLRESGAMIELTYDLQPIVWTAGASSGWTLDSM